MNRRELLKKSALAAAGFGALPTVSLLFQQCSVVKEIEYIPKYLTQVQFDTVSRMAEIILPTTDTPGANEAGVAEYIDLLFAEYFRDEEKERLTNGLLSFMENCNQTFQSPFLEMKNEAQVKHLIELNEAAMEMEESFFKSFKGLVLWAFFTSEDGMKSMDYKPVPGQYDGCISIDESTKNLVGNR